MNSDFKSKEKKFEKRSLAYALRLRHSLQLKLEVENDCSFLSKCTNGNEHTDSDVFFWKPYN